MSHQTLERALKASSQLGASRQRCRFRAGLAVAQLALALTLTIGAGLMIRSFVRLVSVDPGFETHGVLTFQLSVPRYRFEEPARWDTVTEVVLERVGAVPGVEAVAASSWTPLSRAWAGAQMSIEATSGDVVEREQWPLILGVTRRCCMIPDNPKGISNQLPPAKRVV